MKRTASSLSSNNSQRSTERRRENPLSPRVRAESPVQVPEAERAVVDQPRINVLIDALKKRVQEQVATAAQAPAAAQAQASAINPLAAQAQAEAPVARVGSGKNLATLLAMQAQAQAEAAALEKVQAPILLEEIIEISKINPEQIALLKDAVLKAISNLPVGKRTFIDGRGNIKLEIKINTYINNILKLCTPKYAEIDHVSNKDKALFREEHIVKPLKDAGASFDTKKLRLSMGRFRNNYNKILEQRKNSTERPLTPEGDKKPAAK